MTHEEKTAETTPAPKKKSSWFKRILIILFLIFIGIQFLQPDKNNQSMDMSNDISKVVTVPDSVYVLLKNSCYDCHSNFTNYPWYSNIQPLGWWLKDHIDEGKEHLNFQEFALIKANNNYKTAALRQFDKLDAMIETVEEREMPLESYTIIHKEAKLSDLQRKMIAEWAKSAQTELTK